jgi:hypothetical protein
MPNEANNENVTLEMHHVENYKEFSCIDNRLQCYDNEDSEEAVVE